MKFTLREIIIYILAACLIGGGMAVIYAQGVNNGKIEMCNSQGLKYGRTIAGDDCLTELDANKLLLRPRKSEKVFNLTTEDQWQIT